MSPVLLPRLNAEAPVAIRIGLLIDKWSFVVLTYNKKNNNDRWSWKYILGGEK